MIKKSIQSWFDNYSFTENEGNLIGSEQERIEWVRILPFIAIHLLCFAIFWVGFSLFALLFCIAFYFVRMFFITAFYHRYFSHRTFQTNRFFQFIFAALGNTAIQRGALWWAAHHRWHHRYSDTEKDVHSPTTKGFWMSHVFWFTNKKNYRTKLELVKDLRKFPELVFLDRFNFIIPVALVFGIYFLGEFLAVQYPHLQTSGQQLFIWGFCLSTVLLYHGTFTINSLAHQYGSRRYQTKDDSRNNLFLSLITLGEGWHNNHHHYPNSVRQGFFWWEIDLTFYLLKLMSFFGIVSHLKPVPQHVKERR